MEESLKDIMESSRLITEKEIKEIREKNKSHLNPEQKRKVEMNEFSEGFIRHMWQFYLNSKN